MRAAASLPDGTTQVLFRIDDWDFNWRDLIQADTTFLSQAVHA